MSCVTKLETLCHVCSVVGARYSKERREDEANTIRRCIRTAFDKLTEHSLIIPNSAHDSYSMHPFVQEWVRLLLPIASGEQSMWAVAEATFLCHGILLPPFEDSRETSFPVWMLCSKDQEALEECMKKNRARCQCISIRCKCSH